jgi:hypothetical protein
MLLSLSFFLAFCSIRFTRNLTKRTSRSLYIILIIDPYLSNLSIYPCYPMLFFFLRLSSSYRSVPSFCFFFVFLLFFLSSILLDSTGRNFTIRLAVSAFLIIFLSPLSSFSFSLLLSPRILPNYFRSPSSLFLLLYLTHSLTDKFESTWLSSFSLYTIVSSTYPKYSPPPLCPS